MSKPTTLLMMMISRVHGDVINSRGVCRIFEALKRNDIEINDICLSDADVDDECLMMLGELINVNTNINHVEVILSNISDKGIGYLAPYMKGNRSVKSMSFSYNKKITSASVQHFISIIENSAIESIHIDGTSIAKPNSLVPHLAQNVLKNGSSDNLSFISNSVTDDDIGEICKLLRKYGCKSVHSIFLSCNEITSKGAVELFNTIKEENLPIELIDLYANNLDDNCMNALGQMLEDNKYISSINIGCHLSEDDGKITDAGIEILAPYLVGNMSLKSLDLSYSKHITEQSFVHLMDVAEQSCIEKISLFRTSIPKDKEHELAKTLLVSVDSREIPLISNTKPASKATYKY